MREFEEPIIGQEAVCSDGLGRVAAFDFIPPNRWIQVDTYINNRSCKWDVANVTLVTILKQGVARQLVMYCDPEGKPRAWGVAESEDVARAEAQRQLAAYREKKREVGDLELADAHYTEEVEHVE